MKYRYLHFAVLTALICLTLLFLVANSLHREQEEKKTVQAFLQEQRQSVQLELPALPAVFSFEEAVEAAPKALLKYQSLYEQNHDFAGWIEIEGTPVHLPVMYTPEDGEYYLRRFFDKSDNAYGTPFIDARCTLEPRSTNLIIHGHNMADDEMFGTLPRYAEKEYFEEHPVIRFDTPTETGEYQIVSAFLSRYDENEDATNRYYSYTDLEDPAELDEFSALVRGLSLYDTGYILEPGDEVITLITCSYHTTNGRMTVIAKKMA